MQTAQFPLEMLGPGDWKLTVPPEVKEFTLSLSYAIPLAPPVNAEAAVRPIPVGLLWPTTASRAETTVRVWSNTVTAQAIVNRSPGWREQPIEPVADRDALPILVLSASGGEIPLMLEASEIEGGSAVAIWVDRGLIQAWLADDGTIRYRARFPGTALARTGDRDSAPRTPGRFVPRVSPRRPTDRCRSSHRIERHASVSNPTARSAVGRTTRIEIRYHLPAAGDGDTEYRPPLLPPSRSPGRCDGS